MTTPSKDEKIVNPNLSNKEAVSLRQKNVQNVLLNTFSQIQTAPNGLHTQPRDSTGQQGETRYRDIINYLGSPESLVSIMSNPTKVTSFLNATSPQLAQLVPLMKFFYEGPAGDEEFVFSDYADYTAGGMAQTLAAYRTKPDSAVILKNRGTLGTDVGVQSFNWTFDNKHEGDKTLKADLTLYFGSITELLNQEYLKFIFVNNEDQIGPKRKDEAGNTQTDNQQELEVRQKIANRYRLMMKGLTSGRSSDQTNRELREGEQVGVPPKDYRSINEQAGFRQLKVLVGWAIPKGKDFELQTDFREAVAATQKVIALHMVKYELSFEQEGQVSLSIQYVGSLDSVLSSEKVSNVLEDGPSQVPVQKKDIPIQTHMSMDEGFFNVDVPIVGNAYKYFKDEAFKGTFDNKTVEGFLRKKASNPNNVFKDVNTDRESFRISYEKVDFELTTLRMHLDYLKKFKEGEVKKIEEVQKGIAACEVALQFINAKIAAEKFSKFMKILFGTGKVSYMTVEKFTVRKGDNGNARTRKRLREQQKRREARRAKNTARSQAKVKTRGSVADQRTRDKIEDRMKNAINNEILRSRAGKKDYTASQLASLDPLSTDGKSSDLLEFPGKITVYYVRLGDIISAAMFGMPEIIGFERRIMLGSFMPFPLTIGGCSETEIWSLADIPIAIDYFGQWFLDNFVQKDPLPANISFRRFIDLLLNTLVAPLFNETFARDKTNKIKFQITTTTTSIKVDKGKVVTGDELKSLAKSQGINQGLAGAPLYSYMLISMDQTNANLAGDKEKDEDQGIFHLIIGHDRGIVKSFTFTEKQMPSLRAMHIVNNNQGSSLVLPQDVELKMFGNTLFKNGQRIHINADFALGSSVARKLGIGGYYTVVKSSNTMAAGEFSTTVTCMFEKPTKGPQ